MLYDPKWQTKVDPLTMESLVAWLEKQPPLKRYDYWDCNGKCLYGQYMASHGIAWAESGGASSTESGPARDEFCSLVYDKVSCSGPKSFGAALKRARKALRT